MKMCIDSEDKVLKAIIDEAIEDYFKQQRMLGQVVKPLPLEKPILYSIK